MLMLIIGIIIVFLFLVIFYRNSSLNLQVDNPYMLFYNEARVINGIAFNSRTGKPFVNSEINRVTIFPQVIPSRVKVFFTYKNLIISNDLSGFSPVKILKSNSDFVIDQKKYYILEK